MSFEQAFPDTAQEGREALARSMCRFLPVMAEQARTEGATDEWVWRQMASLAAWLAREGEPPAPGELAAGAAQAIARAAARMVAANVGDPEAWTQIQVMARRIADGGAA